MGNTTFLYNMWYMVMPGKNLKSGKMISKTLLGQKLLIVRAANNEVSALRDLCPHRGIPLSYGQFDGREITCRYHGWQFNTAGQCTAIPSLTCEQNFKISKVKVESYPCKEVQGNIWIFMSQPQADKCDELPPVPMLPEIGSTSAQLMESKLLPCDYDRVVLGLMDPARGPFVHVKYVSTEITFSLQGLRRIERIKARNHTIYALTMLTPVTETTTQVHQCFYWGIPWLAFTKPFLRRWVRTFLKRGLKKEPQSMVINDADTQAKWYYQLKDEYLLSQKTTLR